jgi:formylglycine-generating enzyme required for sulfatase activity
VCNFSANGYRLPTEAEWEFAATGGIKSKAYTYSGSNTIDNVAWYVDNAGNATHTTATKTPNELGFYDMSGNVAEWCWDRYAAYTGAAQSNPTGPNSGQLRITRGGSWGNHSVQCRSTARDAYDPNLKNDSYFGFRVVTLP